ncbi:MAG: nickel pincer cofactor biosynthesis protein LarC [Desulfitobacteriaceae bacterium]
MIVKKKVLYFDCFAGASGDMIVGAFLDLGVDQEALKQELTKLPLKGYKINAQKITKAGFSATKFDVLDEVGQNFDNLPHNHDSHQNSSHEHRVHRNLGDIVTLIKNSDLVPQIKVKSIAIFQKLANAEAKIHGTVPEKIHFHEVGAVDAIVDIVGAVIALHLLDVDKLVVSPLPLGQGFVRCQHGLIPVPAPATLELLIGMQTFGSEHQGETVTPTGAAILSTLADGCGSMPAFEIVKVGYGAGTRDFEIPNLLRAVIGLESQDTLAEQEYGLKTSMNLRAEIIIGLEANIDDMNPEFYDYIIESLLLKGAMDVFLVPILMKKNRPAQMLRILCQEKDLLEITKTLFLESSSIGVRFQSWQRYCLDRVVNSVHTPYGDIRIKEAFWEGEMVNLAPEYDDCKKKAKDFGVPLKEVYRATLEAARARKGNLEKQNMVR